MESGKIDFSQLEILVLDEADRMLDMGFIDDIEKIVAATPATRQTMLFSATLDGVVGNMARRITKDPQIIQIMSSANKHENITQRVHFVDDLSHKNRLLDHLLRDESLDQAVVFTATKRDADTIADRLNIAGSRPPHCMATCTRARVTARWTACAAARSRCWSPPTLPPRHRRADHHPRVQLRPAEVPGRLRAPYRPYRPRRPQRPGHLAGQPR
jgi:hypothetical protein